MGRQIHTVVSQVANLLIPDWSHLQGFEEKDRKYKQQQKKQYDSCHRVRSVPTLPDDKEVWVNIQGRKVPRNRAGGSKIKLVRPTGSKCGACMTIQC